MAFQELVKNFNRIRETMRAFYVYGFKSRQEFTGKSARSYDDERRRIQSWLGSYMQFQHTPTGKNVFLSFDTRNTKHNPLYKAFKTKSFTELDITLHFLLFDILEEEEGKTLSTLMEEMDARLDRAIDESTVRKKLKEYVQEGLVQTQKTGKTVTYRRSQETPLPDSDVLDLFSEILPCGVVGSFLLDKTEPHESIFTFKHHYITSTLDSEVLLAVFLAMQEKRFIRIKVLHEKKKHEQSKVVPLRIYISAANGRQYLLAEEEDGKHIISLRIDNIVSISMLEVCKDFDQRRTQFLEKSKHMWGVSTHNLYSKPLEHVEFTICYREEETYIPQRLVREKRCGTVEHLDKTHSRFRADVTDAHEMIPWIRTFLCRITSIHFSNQKLQDQFENDLREMLQMYDMEDDHALQ